MLDVERPNLVEELAETFDQSIQLTLEVFNQSFSLGFGGFHRQMKTFFADL